MEKKRDIILLTLLCLIIAFMDISGLPGILLNISIADVDEHIIPLMINFLIIGIFALIFLWIFGISYNFGFTTVNLKSGLRRYSIPGIIAAVFSFIAFYAGLYPFDSTPSIWKILFEGIIYYIGVGIVEEFYVRGLFLNLVESIASRSKNKTTIAVLVSSIVFGLGHIPGMIGMTSWVILFKLISTIGMGFYFGTIYKKTNNLWLPIIMHSLIDISALPYCFTQNMRYEPITLEILLITYICLSIYCVIILTKKEYQPAEKLT